MSEAISLNGREITYDLERKSVKNINLRIRSDGSVYVSVNPKVANSVITGFLIKKADYIVAALDKYEELRRYADGERSFCSGESFRYLGKELRLVVSQGRNQVYIDGIHLYLTVTDTTDKELKQKLIRKWYDVECNALFPAIVNEIYPVFRKYGVPEPRLSLREMTSRWGSCRPKRGTITLNKRLIETPRICIEYVVMHELVHFRQPNHSKNFYNLLSTLMPDWNERKAILEKGYTHQFS
jgi:predicted metal-dependent hydrolase